MAIFVMFVAIIIATGNGMLSTPAWASARQAITTITIRIGYYCGGALLLFAFLRAKGYRGGLLIAFLIGIAINATTHVLLWIYPNSSLEARSVAATALNAFEFITNPLRLGPLVLLLLVQFKGSWDWARMAGIGAILLVMLTGIASAWLGGIGYTVLYMAIYVFELLALIVAAWCMTFHLVPSQSPSDDASGKGSLTCPHCGQPMAAGTAIGT